MQRTAAADDLTADVRRIPVAGWIGIVLVYLAIIQIGGRVLTAGVEEASYGVLETDEQVFRQVLIPIGLSLLFVYSVVALLGWWRPVLTDDRPVQPWLRIVPIVFIVGILLAINYAGLADKGVSFIVLLALGCLCIGFAEEGMYRGLGVTTFRVNGYTEGKVALWTSVVFGLSHVTNIFSEGDGALIQAFIVMFAGYFFYLARRWAGTLVLPALLHASYDFSLFSGTLKENEVYAGSAAAALVTLILAVIIYRRRHRIEPEPPAPGNSLPANPATPPPG